MEIKKLRLEKRRFVITFLITGLVVEILSLGGYSLFSVLGNYYKINWLLFSIVGLAIAILMVVCGVLGFKNSYYEVSKKGITYYRAGKKEDYIFDHIIYIDEAKSKKHGVIEFYDDKLHYYSIANDEEKTLMDTMKKYCTNLISKEEFIERYSRSHA